MKLSLSMISLLLLVIACQSKTDKEIDTKTNTSEKYEPFFDISLAQWSLNKPFFAGEMDAIDFPKIAKELGFDAVEYVAGFYWEPIKNSENPEAELEKKIAQLKESSKEHGVKNLLIMVDGQGDLSDASEAVRNDAVEQHKKWVNAAAELGCHSIRVNLFGAQEEDTWKTASIDGLSKLADYAATKNINVLVENHGGFSSNGKLLMEVMNAVNKDNVGTLPDFGNFCIRREGGQRWGAPCVDEYDMYKGIAELMPKAFGVSAKSYHFDAKGEETKIDYAKMLQIIKDAGYKGYIDVEYEGEEIPPVEGIKLTRDLLINASKHLK